MTATPLFGVKKTNKKTTEYFVGTENSEVKFSQNFIHGFTSHDKSAMTTLAEVLSTTDKRNKYETYEIKIG